jgi:hypothetical protein
MRIDFFPALKEKSISVQVCRAFKKVGVSWGSFYHFRHFAACELINPEKPGNPKNPIKTGFPGFSGFRDRGGLTRSNWILTLIYYI